MSRTCATDEYIKDYLTGREIPDSDDEQIRQTVERLLVEKLGYEPNDINVDLEFEMRVDDEVHIGRAELVVFLENRPVMTIKSNRGSLVTREREALAASRLATDLQAPFTVVTNGEDAEILDSLSGKVIAEGMTAIPSKKQALERLAQLAPMPLAEKRREKEARIYLAFAGFQCPTDCET